MRASAIFLLCSSIIPGALAQATCGDVQLQLSPDYSFAIGSSSGGGQYSFKLGGKTLSSGVTPQLALFHYDKSLDSTSAVAPSESAGSAPSFGRFAKSVSRGTSGHSFTVASASPARPPADSR